MKNQNEKWKTFVFFSEILAELVICFNESIVESLQMRRVPTQKVIERQRKGKRKNVHNGNCVAKSEKLNKASKSERKTLPIKQTFG